jgi:predicted nucleotidyltransferase component of viral defense system
MITQEQIQVLAKQRNIDQATILREYVQVLLLKELYQEKLSQRIYFKGGTAIHLLLGGTRYSMDLDFTAEFPAATLNQLLAKICQRLEIELPGISFKSSRKKINHSFSKILTYLPQGRKIPLNIAVDFSLREKPRNEVKKTILKTDFPISGLPVILHLDWAEILSEKIRALLIRGKGRDFYDLYYLLYKGIKIDWNLVGAKMKIYPNFKKELNLNTITSIVEKFKPVDLHKDMAQFLPRTERQNLLPILKQELIKELTQSKL